MSKNSDKILRWVPIVGLFTKVPRGIADPAFASAMIIYHSTAIFIVAVLLQAYFFDKPMLHNILSFFNII